MFRKKLLRFATGTLVAGLLCGQIVGVSAQSTTNEDPTTDSTINAPAVADGGQPEDANVQAAQTVADAGLLPADEEPQGISGDDSISAAAVDAFDALVWNVQNRLGIGTTTPGYRLDVTDRIRVRQGKSGSAGIWLFQTGPNTNRAFVGMANNNLVGFWGSTIRRWGLLMDTTNGNVGIGIGTANPQAMLHVGRGPSWTSGNWGASIGLANGTAIGWAANAAGQRFGMGHTDRGFVIFRTASDLSTTTSPTQADFFINDNGNIGVGTGSADPQAKLDVGGTANNQWGMRISSTGGSAKGLLISTAFPGNSNIPLFQANAGSPGNEVPRFVIQANGNVGVGTMTPAANLDIAGTGNQVINLSTTDPEGSILRLMAVSSNHNTESQIQFKNKLVLGAPVGGNSIMTLFENGNVGIGIGSADPQAKLDVGGTTRTQVLQITGGADLAEPFVVNSAQAVEPGMVVAIDPENPGQLRLAGKAYDHMVAGVVSGAGGIQPGLILQQEGTIADGDHPVALSGRVYVWADASNGPIQPGDLLTTSSTPGHAMKVTDHGQAQGSVLGKAMGTLEEGTGLVLMLVTLQ